MPLSKSSRSSSKSKDRARSRSKSKSSKGSDKGAAKSTNPFKRTATFLDNCVLERLGIVIKGLECFPGLPTLATDLDALHTDDSDLVFQITCKNVQERPPLKSINRVAQPFLPRIRPFQNENFDLQDPDRAAFVFSQQYQVWKSKISASRSHTKRHVVKTIKSQMFDSEDNSDEEDGGYAGESGFFAICDPSVVSKKALQVYEKCPLAPLNLYTSSCLQPWSEKIASSDHTGNLSVSKIGRKKVRQLNDPNLSTFSRVFGFKTHGGLAALRYQDGIAIVDSNNELKSRLLVKQSSFCDLAFLPFMDSILAINEDSQVILHNYETKEDFENYCDVGVGKHKWCQIENQNTSMFWTRVASRKRLSLYDVRKKTKLDDLYAFPPGEVCGGMTKSTHSPYQMYATTNMKTMLIDERYSKTSMTHWYHPNWDQNGKIPGGIASQYLPLSRYEYVLSFWPDGDVNLLVNDWSHSLCTERTNSDTKIVLSCQNDPDLYPLSRGYPVMVPSTNFLRNHHVFAKESSYSRLDVPWTGLTTFSNYDENELKIMAVNAVGDIFEALLNHDPNLIADDLFEVGETIEDPFCDMDQSINVITDKVMDFDALASEHINLPVDTHKLNWLNHRPLQKSEKEELQAWEESLPTFQKVSFATKVYQRDALPKIGRLKRSMYVVEKKEKRFVSKPRARYSVPRVLKKKKEMSPFSNCQTLWPAKLKNEAEVEGDDVMKIFSDEKPSFFTTDTEFSETDSEFGEEDDYKSIKAKTRETRRTKHLPKGLPDDAGYTMEQFLQGLDDPDSNMTSTQQTQESVTFVEQDKSYDASSFLEAQSRSSSKKKKPKKKKVAGF